jgi:hypothetical protein
LLERVFSHDRGVYARASPRRAALAEGYLLGYIQLLRYDLLLSGLLLTLAVVIVIDRLSALLRRTFLVPVSSPAPAE